MNVARIWPVDARIIEFGAADCPLGERLVDAGFARWLGVLGDEPSRAALTEARPRLTARLTVARSSKAVRRNNAEVLILHGRAGLHVAAVRSIRHAAHVALPVRLAPAFLLAAALALVQCLLGRLVWPVVASCGGESGPSIKLLSFRVRRRRATRAARRFIPHALGVEGFLRALDAGHVRHAVLRWFESLPALPPGEDLDLLVEDAALARVRGILDSGPGLQPVDLYSVTGLPGSDYQGVPYFPPRVAERILERAVAHRDLCRVPSPEDHFLSLAYHALYHKGPTSGLPTSGGQKPPVARAEHDYAAVLHVLAERAGIEVAATLADLDRCLDARGWRPPHDMLVRLSRRNAWVRSLLDEPQAGEEDRGLAVFLLREVALARGGVARAVALLERHGFHVVETLSFSPPHAQDVAASIRGANWGPGPWSISGGPPAAAIVAYDFAPIAPSRRQKKKFPFLTNARLLAKGDIRDAFNEGFPAREHCNVVHSSDNGREAINYLRAIVPDRVDEVLARIEELNEGRDAVHAKRRAA